VYGDNEAGFEEAFEFFLSDSPAELLLQMRTAESRYRHALFWLHDEALVALPPLQSLPGDVTWLPGQTGVLIRQGGRQVLWSDFRSGTPAPWVEISVFE